MNLNLPDIKAFREKTILLVGAGGGYDYLGAEPLACELGARGSIVTTKNLESEVGRAGVIPVQKYIQKVVDETKADVVVMVDGGVDALMVGDEVDGGTLLEDSVNLAALSEVKVSHKILSCIGFGTENEEGLSHYWVLKNIADLIREDAFYGSCSVTRQQLAFKRYKEVAELTWEGGKRKSHIHTKVIGSILGNFGDDNPYEGADPRTIDTKQATCLTPLMGIYWFFDAQKVAERNLLVPLLKPTTTSTDALMVYRQYLQTNVTWKETKKIPLS